MKILVTAGNTQTPIDKVRCITNIFSGRTGTPIALQAFRTGHEVCLLTSHPEVINELAESPMLTSPRWRVRRYRSFSDLHQLMEGEIVGGSFDTVIHGAAVSDYAIAGTFSLRPGADFDPETQSLNSSNGQIALVGADSGKVKSNHKELWLRLIPTPKLVDSIRTPWGFQGTLVKFKLEVGVSEDALKSIAESSRLHSHADLIVANTYEC